MYNVQVLVKAMPVVFTDKMDTFVVENNKS